ncbi:DNA-binding transcriptional regulator, MarR family [Nocardioides exalbidus]|uniref:DNA-binding transcriptional regulator, MarR family n=1 Tax=Nocardioides exalbidus TaxID=402596 RepID=A0A1H4WDS7_9ACTN|nr:MarR family transcriptional regulator [Nocardioides exalbidus]SEC91427.1 DNA-binding transcriptional regulator, MarR family [Nocardioides exalbidus]
MPPSDLAEVTDETLTALRHELMRLGRRRETGSSVTDLDASAFKILWLVVEHGPHTLRGLSEGLQLEQSTINRQVHAAVDRGWVERYDDPDCPAMLVRATAPGETAYRLEADARAEGLREIVNTLGDRATSDLAGGLARFNDAIDDAIGRKLTP